GIAVEAQHHEVAAGGQCEIDMRFDTLLTMADRLLLYKYIVKNVARRAGMSEMARMFIGGLLTHAPSILAFAAPSTNSYRRLVPGYEAPVNLVYSQRNRSAA